MIKQSFFLLLLLLVAGCSSSTKRDVAADSISAANQSDMVAKPAVPSDELEVEHIVFPDKIVMETMFDAKGIIIAEPSPITKKSMGSIDSLVISDKGRNSEGLWVQYDVISTKGSCECIYVGLIKSNVNRFTLEKVEINEPDDIKAPALLRAHITISEFKLTGHIRFEASGAQGRYVKLQINTANPVVKRNNISYVQMISLHKNLRNCHWEFVLPDPKDSAERTYSVNVVLTDDSYENDLCPRSS